MNTPPFPMKPISPTPKPSPLPVWLQLKTKSRKLAALIIGAIATLVSTGLVPEPWNTYANAVILIGTAVGVYTARNEPV